jgi:hypothetical protein
MGGVFCLYRLTVEYFFKGPFAGGLHSSTT